VVGVAFRFDADDHSYTLVATGEERPHVTSMLGRAGWIDDTWMTEESSARGQQVHHLTADYDLGALNPSLHDAGPYRAYVLAHAKAMRSIAHTWEAIEVPLMHPRYLFGGRPDRVGLALGLRTVLEVKSGDPLPGHRIQTALQAILAAEATPHPSVPADYYQRGALYLRPTGKFKLELHKDRRDLDEARRIIRKCCGA
jgi:hypothetical protein